MGNGSKEKEGLKEKTDLIEKEKKTGAGKRCAAAFSAFLCGALVLSFGAVYFLRDLQYHRRTSYASSSYSETEAPDLGLWEYMAADGVIQIRTPAGVKTYCGYNQENYGDYYARYGCVTTAVSIAASVFGQRYSPDQIHEEKSSVYFSERYALRQMNAPDDLHGKASISVTLAAQILEDIGIPNQPVCVFSPEEAVGQIRSHLQEGKPVIVKVNHTEKNHIKLANGHHAIVLIGIDENDGVIFVNPVGSRVNYAHGSDGICSLKIEDLVQNHMAFERSDLQAPYVTDSSRAGGYILVG